MFNRKVSTLNEVLEAAQQALKNLIVDFENLEKKISKINELVQSSSINKHKLYDSTNIQVYDALNKMALLLAKYDYFDTLLEKIDNKIQEKLNSLIISCDDSLSHVMSHPYFRDSSNYRKDKEKFDKLLAECSAIKDELIPSARPGLT
ncbi:MAG: hypothetical protein P4M12_04660 [Gammaproteobacteria bacterium]|nr:hypothetical protein [Gammaproteobacteria bacterium]